jgi:DNA-binding GntR family transcriptional regulator
MAGIEGAVLHRTTTAQQLADLLSERILAGAFRPGDRLRESAIATELGVARNTVREAVRVLELGGLVRYEVNRGAVVISPTTESLDAVYTARERLETAAAARLATAEQIARLEAAYTNLAAATRTRDTRRVVEVDLAFHATIVSFLDSARLDLFYAELTRELRYYLMVLSVEDRELDKPRALLREHKAILDAIRTGPPEAAVAAVRGHIHDNAQRVTEILNARTQTQLGTLAGRH